jgi:hypothetical protein
MTPIQEWNLVPPSNVNSGPIEYSTRAAKFFNVNEISLFFLSNFESSNTSIISFLSVQGEFSHSKIGVVETNYESKPQLADHKIENIFSNISKTGF